MDFHLFDLLKIGDLSESGYYGDHSKETFRMALAENGADDDFNLDQFPTTV